jgi:hypothetical protein
MRKDFSMSHRNDPLQQLITKDQPYSENVQWHLMISVAANWISTSAEINPYPR